MQVRQAQASTTTIMTKRLHRTYHLQDCTNGNEEVDDVKLDGTDKLVDRVASAHHTKRVDK